MFSPGPLIRQIKDLTLATGLSLSLSHRAYAQSLSLSLSLSLLFFYIDPSQSLCFSSQSVCLYQESPLADTSFSRSLSICLLRLRLFLLSPFGEDTSRRNRAFVPRSPFTKYTGCFFSSSLRQARVFELVWDGEKSLGEKVAPIRKCR